MTGRNPPDAVFFDLDGTLADTAADLTRALNAVLAERDRPTIDPDRARPYVSRGAIALIRLGFGLAGDDPVLPELRARFLVHYRKGLCVESRLFPGIEPLLDQLASRAIPYGIVTNKPRAYTLPLLKALVDSRTPASVVCGDDLAVNKPHPAPLRLACARIGTPPFNCAFVGDDRRDVVAGQRAGMVTVAAAWGYIGPGEDPRNWGAHRLVDTPYGLGDVLELDARD